MTTTTAQAYIMQPGGGDAIENLHVRFLATGDLTGGALTVAEVVNPGPGGPPLHIHHAQDEFFFVVAGRYRFQVDDQIQEGGQGMFAYAPRGVAHSFASLGSEEGRLFAGNMPSGLEHFVRRLGELELGRAIAGNIEELFREYDSEICGPPLV